MRRARPFALVGLVTAAPLPAQEHEVLLDNGVRLVVLDRPALPLVTFSLFLRGGLLLDSKTTFRHSVLAMGGLWLGHGGLDEDSVRGALADVGAEYGSQVDLQDTRIHLSCLSAHAAAGFALFAGAVFEPSYHSAIVARERELEQRTLAQRTKQPDYLAQEALIRELAGEHPLADAFALHDAAGSLASVDREALLATWTRMVQPQLATLFVVGRVDAKLLDAVRARFGAWRQPATPTVLDERSPKLEARPGRVIKVPLPEMTQVYIQLGMLGPAASDPAMPAVHSLRMALAGGFTSMLEDDLRVTRGLVYDISFTGPPLTIATPHSLRTQTLADKVTEVLDAVAQALRAAAHDKITPAQLEAARNLWLGTRALERETQLGLADAMYRSLRAFGDLGGRQRELDAVRATTLRDIADAAALFDPARFVVVLVGAPEALAKIDWVAK